MSWNRYLRGIQWFTLFQGVWTEDSTGDIPFNQTLTQSLVGKGLREVPGASYLQRATNVYGPGVSRVLRKRPGFSKIQSTTINAAGIWTGFVHLGEIADKFYGTASIVAGTHDIYDFANNPPTVVSGGTNFTVGADNLITPLLFTDGTTTGTIFVSRLRDLPQFISGAGTRSNFTIAGTGLTSLKPAIGEIFNQRAVWGDVNFDGTVYDDRLYWTDIRDGNLITDPTTQFLSFETRLKDRVRGLHKLSDICVIGKLNNIFTMVATQDAATPFIVQEEAAGQTRGVVSHQSMVEAGQRLFWMGNSNIHSIDQNFQIWDWADAIQPTIRGLNDARRQFTVAGVDTDRSLILFNVSDGTDTTNDLTIALNHKTGALYFWDLRRNAYGLRAVSDEIRLTGGGYVGLAYYELTGTAGALDDAAAVIGADVITPKYWVNYGAKAKIPYVALAVDPVGTESLTVTYALDDEDILTSPRTPAGSPYAVTGSTHKIFLVPIKAFAERIQLRIYNNTADAVYNVKAIGVPGITSQPVSG